MLLYPVLAAAVVMMQEVSGVVLDLHQFTHGELNLTRKIVGGLSHKCWDALEEGVGEKEIWVNSRDSLKPTPLSPFPALAKMQHFLQKRPLLLSIVKLKSFFLQSS